MTSSLVTVLWGIVDSSIGLYKGLRMILTPDINEKQSSRDSKSTLTDEESYQSSVMKKILSNHRKRQILRNSAYSLGKCVVMNIIVASLFVWIISPIVSLFASFFNISSGILASSFIFLEIFYFNLSPIVAIRLLCALWFSDIAYDLISRAGFRPARISDSRYKFADIIVTLVVEAIFTCQALLISFVLPSIFGIIGSILHFSLLYSLYSFEYLWMFHGYGLSQRIAIIEQNWPYFLGYGLPLALITMISSSFVVNASIFGIFYPFYIASTCAVDFERHLPRQKWSFPIFRPSYWLASKFVALSVVIIKYFKSPSRR